MLSPIDTNGTTPRHQQVYERLLGLIRAGHWKVGEQVPSELELAAELGVAKLTVHRAVQTLAREGWVTRQVGRGTFVASEAPLSGLHRVLLAFGASATNILGSDYYGGLYQGIAETLGPGVELVLCPDAFTKTSLPPADGILVIAPRESASLSLAKLALTDRPTVVVGAHWPGLPLTAGAARQVAQHLAALGHEHIALVFAEPETTNTQDRVRGFQYEATTLGLTTTEHPAQEFWRLTCEEKEALLASVHAGATAVFAAGYYLALDVLNALREAKFRVPEDISVVGFDDPASAPLIYPPLTTLRQPLYEMGQRAAQRLAALVASASRNDDEKLELLPVALILRSSTTKPKDKSL
jgi:GntR family transcriptional regulator, arabinose operon transcriptional repressor